MKCTHISIEGVWTIILEKTTLSTPSQDSNLDLLFIGSLVYCESSALDHAATEAGDRKYHIPNLVPLIISELKINQEGNQAIGFSFVAKNATVLGINTVEVDEVMIDLKSGHVEYHLLFPRIEIECDYDVKGRILLLPISGHGSGNITIRYVPHLPHPSYATDHQCAMPIVLSVCTLMRASSQLLRCNKRVEFLKLNLVYLVRGVNEL
uniref:Uncharacterized protein n=1 Tax=Timema bartmani TaxID=61472 RepID=A0A7R9HZW4_9NEOP|nr:unnamed protein product [Timema bartmani]